MNTDMSIGIARQRRNITTATNTETPVENATLPLSGMIADVAIMATIVMTMTTMSVARSFVAVRVAKVLTIGVIWQKVLLLVPVLLPFSIVAAMTTVNCPRTVDERLSLELPWERSVLRRYEELAALTATDGMATMSLLTVPLDSSRALESLLLL
jgi:hypothetical protein